MNTGQRQDMNMYNREAQDIRQRIVMQVSELNAVNLNDYFDMMWLAIERRQESNGGILSGNAKVSPYTPGNFGWILAALTVLYYTDFAAVVAYDERIYRTWLMVGLVFVCLFLCVALFMIGYVSWYKKASSDDWETLYPSAIPLATAFILSGGFCLVVSLWPVWSILTPVILFVLLMGTIVIIAMVP